jgi:hypothetical protein
MFTIIYLLVVAFSALTFSWGWLGVWIVADLLLN